MKKSFLIFTLLFLILNNSTFVDENRLVFDFGITGFVKAYPYEQISYEYMWDNSFSLGIAFRAMENIVRPATKDTSCYFQPGISISYCGSYVAAGPMFQVGMTSIKETSFWLRQGYRFGDWDWGNGKGGGEIAAELSITPYYFNDSDEFVANMLLTILNCIKLNAGITWSLPF